MSPDLALRIIAQACIGLQKAHEANIIHRDIKPASIFLHRREEGEVIVKLLNVGIAKVKMDHAQDVSTGDLIKTGHMLGSPLSMSPEQALGNKDADHLTAQTFGSSASRSIKRFAGRLRSNM